MSNLTMLSRALGSLMLGVSLAASSPALAQGVPISVTLTGAEEAPGPGDPDGVGEFIATFNPGLREVCYQLSVEDIAPATAAHIHIAPVGEPGPVVIGLTAPTSGSSSACVSADRDLILAIIRNPSAYYVNVHNAAFPAGAVRAQLSRGH